MSVTARNADILVGATSSPATFVADINDFSVSIGAENLDTTSFAATGPTFISRVQGLKDGSWSLSGFYNHSDAGQVVIRDAYMNDTDLYIKIKYDGTNGFQQQVRVSSFDVSGSVDGIAELSIDLEGTGPVTVTTS